MTVALKIGRIILFYSPLLFSVIWPLRTGLRSAIAMWTMPEQKLSQIDFDEPQARLDVKRAIQRHFREYDIYLPLEDIMLRSKSSEFRQKIFLFLDKVCGHANLYVWVPLKFSFPIIGNKVKEWCWIPKISTQEDIEE